MVSFRSTLLLVALLAPASMAQEPAGDTALSEGIEATGDTAEVRALTAWAEENRQSHPEEARQAAERALALARELDDQRGIGQSLTTLGNLASDSHRMEGYYMAAREAFERIGDKRSLIGNRQNMGVLYHRRGNLEKALTAYFEALEGFERLGATKGQVSVLNNIGLIHHEQGNVEMAKTHYEKAVALVETLDEPILLASSLINLGFAFSGQGYYEQAKIHFRRALVIAEEEEAQYFIAVISNNLGHVFNEQGRYQHALPHLRTAERLSKKLENEEVLGAVYDEFGKAYLGLEQINRALRYASERLVLAQEMGTIRQQMVAHRTLSQIYEAAGDEGQALAHHQQYAAARDSVFTTEKAESINEMQTRYETEEQKRANERLAQENRIQALQLTLLLGSVAGLLLILGVLFYRYRLKQRANRLLEELDAAKSRFFANISHEFRTPLTLLRGPLEDQVKGLSPSQETTKAMLRNTWRMEQLVNEVLDLNRLETGKLVLKPTPGDLVRTLRRLVEANVPLAERKEIDLTFEPDFKHCLRLYDPEKVEKIVGNLLSNALKFTPKGESVQVALHCGDVVEISVSDNGPGIPVEMQENVFERFAQVEDGALHGGTGIGLALAKELTELHGGTITLESIPGEGSTFTVRLPLEETTHDDVQRTAPQRRDGGIPTSEEELEVGGDGEPPSPIGRGDRGEGLDRTTVLIIEDNDDVRAFIRRSLEEAYRVLEAGDGESGLQQARAELPDLIINDVMLPGIDGYDVVRRLKAETDTECIPMVMLTARAAESDHIKGYDSGAEAYITKPFSPGTLRAACTRLLADRQRLRRWLQQEANQAKKESRKNGDVTLRDRTRTAILEHLYDEEFGVEELATALYMSRHTLYRHVKQEMGLSPTDLIRTFRLERARELLSDGKGSVSEVAYAVGFKSRSHFTRSFREHYGMPPLNIRSTPTG